MWQREVEMINDETLLKSYKHNALRNTELNVITYTDDAYNDDVCCPARLLKRGRAKSQLAARTPQQQHHHQHHWVVGKRAPLNQQLQKIMTRQVLLATPLWSPPPPHSNNKRMPLPPLREQCQIP